MSKFKESTKERKYKNWWKVRSFLLSASIIAKYVSNN
jgi:hypothetical protein